LRALVRQAWLELHGLDAASFGEQDLQALLRTLPGVDTEVTETAWTYCAVIRKR